MQVRSLGREDPLEDEMATHSSILAWEIPWTEECGRLQRVGHTWGTEQSTTPWCLGEIRIYSINELTKVMAFDLGAGYSQRWPSASVSRPLETCFSCVSADICEQAAAIPGDALWAGVSGPGCTAWETECDLSPLPSRRALFWGHRLHNWVRGLHLFKQLEQCRHLVDERCTIANAGGCYYLFLIALLSG